MEQLSFTEEDKEKLVFIIHKHDATTLHFDLRLQVGSVMPSWAVPKGPSLSPKLKRLAMQTPDHPMSYNSFEGVLPEGSYGAGPVMIWDRGYYYPEIEISKGVREEIKNNKDGNKIMKSGIEKGEIKFKLFGSKIKGSFALVKTKGFGGKNAWLLIKHKDEFCNEHFDAKDEKLDFSVTSGRNMNEIAISS